MLSVVAGCSDDPFGVIIFLLFLSLQGIPQATPDANGQTKNLHATQSSAKQVHANEDRYGLVGGTGHHHTRSGKQREAFGISDADQNTPGAGGQYGQLGLQFQRSVGHVRAPLVVECGTNKDDGQRFDLLNEADSIARLDLQFLRVLGNEHLVPECVGDGGERIADQPKIPHGIEIDVLPGVDQHAHRRHRKGGHLHFGEFVSKEEIIDDGNDDGARVAENDHRGDWVQLPLCMMQEE